MSGMLAQSSTSAAPDADLALLATDAIGLHSPTVVSTAHFVANTSQPELAPWLLYEKNTIFKICHGLFIYA